MAGFQFPLDHSFVADNGALLVGLTAVLQASLAVAIILGQRQVSSILIGLTLVQTLLMNNPLYRNTTAIDTQRYIRNIFSDLCLMATLFMISGLKKLPDDRAKRD